MLRSRLTILLSGAILCAAAVPAVAQQDTAVRAPKKKGVVQALTERQANPAGPFARLSFIQRDSIIEHTRNLLGVKYKWAGLNPVKGLDCSGIVKYVFAETGNRAPAPCGRTRQDG